MSATSTAVSLKDSAVSFLRLASAGKVDAAYDRFVGPNFRHHDPYFPGDAESLKNGMIQNTEANPNKVFEVKHVVEEGDLVAVHSHVQLKAGQDLAVVHLFRFEDGKVAELWDVGQPVPESSPNTNGMF